MKAKAGQGQDGQNLSRDRKGQGRVLGLLQLLVLVSLLLPTFALPTASATEIPNVVGLTQPAAEAAIGAVGLTVGTVTIVNSTTVPPGTVINQDPDAGINVVPGSAVNLVVSGVTVPNVVGLTQATAQTGLITAGLTVGTVTTTPSTTVPIGSVISQTPVAGSIRAPGSAVALVVSLGTTVPTVVGSTQAAAQAALTTTGLTVGTVTQAHSPTVPIGTVISQTPPAGTNLSPGSAVNLVVSLGVAVPNVVGSTQAAAQTALTTAGLTVGTVTQVNSATVPAGTVISQNPVAGVNVSPGSGVALVVSLGTAVPNVVGLTQAAAQTALTAAGLTVGTVTQANSTTVPIGSVMSQTPAAGTNVPPGSAVALVVSLGAKVPNVVGSTQAAAQTALTTAGLTVGTVTTTHSTTVPIGTIISQNPVAGSNVVPGSGVNLVVSLGVAVPNVVGLSQTAAQTALTGASLAVGTVTQANSATVAIGTVISQTPVAGVNVSPGSAVALVISFGPPAFLMGVQNDGQIMNSLYRIRTDGVVTKIGDLNHRTHGLAFVGSTLYSVEEPTSSSPGTPLNLYTLNPDTGATLSTIPLSLSTGETLEKGRGLATEPGTNQLWGLLVALGEENTFRRLVTINPITGLATQIAKIPGRFVDMAFDAAGMLYAITDNFPVSGGMPPLPAQIYTLNKTTGVAGNFKDVSAGAVAGQPNFRESETIGTGFSSDLLYHLSGQHKVTACCTRNILFETIHLTTKVRTAIPLTGPDFFVTTALTLVPPDSSRRALNDLDGNGKADLVWRNTSDGNTGIWLMNGTTIADAGFPAVVSSEWQIAGMGDVNGDGKADLIWRNGVSGTVAVWLMNGVTITSMGFPATAPTEWAIQAVGDVNGDGKADLVWRNTGSGVVAIWLMNGTAIAASGFPAVLPSEWQIAGAGDVNGDGKADLIWRNSTSGTVAVWLMNGVTITSVGFPATAPTEWVIQAIGDVNGDGKADLVWRNTGSGVVAIWLMDGPAIAASGFQGGVPAEWHMAETVDVNGDSKADVIWRNGTSGLVAIWLMDGLNITSVGFPASTSLDWEIQ